MTVITASPTQFGRLLELQRGLLDQSIAQTIHADVNGQVLRNIREINHEQLNSQKDLIESTKEQVELKRQSELEEKQLKQTEETNKNIHKLAEEVKKKVKEDAKIIAAMAGNVTTFKSISEKIGDAKSNFMNKYGSFGALKRTALSATNVGGIFNKSLAKMDYVKEQKMLGDTRSNADISADFAKQQAASKAIKSNEAKIDAYKKMGLSENQIAKTAEGKKLLSNREKLSSEYAKYDVKARLTDDDNTSEEEMEAARAQGEQTDLLKQLVANTGGNKPKVEAAPSEGKSGGLLDGIMGIFSSGFMSAIGSLFSPAMMLKVITKVFAPLAIIGGVVNGIMDGFKEFSESGDIGEALIAGLGGFLDFLTFGLINKDTLKKVYQSLRESLDSLFGSIGIPEIKFKIPVINKEVTIPEFYPFRMDKKPAPVPAAPEPTAATSVEQRSAENAQSAMQQPSGGNTTAVVAPTTNVKNTSNQVVKLPVRNQDQTMNRYLRSRYA
jgi:hypothetical protein